MPPDATTHPQRTPDKQQASTSKSTQGWVLALTSVASLMVALDALIVSTALGTIRRDLGVSLAQLQWTVNAYTLSLAVLLMAASVLGDRFGRRRVFVAGLGVFVAASAACGLAPSIGWLIVARVVQGAGAAMVLPLALALLSAAFGPERRGWALGVYGGVTGMSAVAGPVVGGAITQGLAWQWIFWLNVPIGVLAILLSRRRLPESFGAPTALDLRGLALVTGATLGVVWGLVRTSSAGWGSAEVIGALAAGALLGATFVAWELRSREPLMPMRLFTLRAFSAGNAAMFFLNASLLGAVFFMAQFQQQALGQDPLGAGLRLLPWGAAMFLMAPRAGALAVRLGERSLIVGGLTLQAIGMAWTAMLAAPGLAYAEMIAPMIIAGAGFGIAIPVVQKAVLGAVAPSDIGKASGILSPTRQLSGALGIAIAVAIFGGAGSYASAHAFSDGFAAAIAAAGALSLLGAITALALPGKPRHTRTAGQRALTPHHAAPRP